MHPGPEVGHWPMSGTEEARSRITGWPPLITSSEETLTSPPHECSDTLEGAEAFFTYSVYFRRPFWEPLKRAGSGHSEANSGCLRISSFKQLNTGSDLTSLRLQKCLIFLGTRGLIKVYFYSLINFIFNRLS